MGEAMLRTAYSQILNSSRGFSPPPPAGPGPRGGPRPPRARRRGGAAAARPAAVRRSPDPNRDRGRFPNPVTAPASSPPLLAPSASAPDRTADAIRESLVIRSMNSGVPIVSSGAPGNRELRRVPPCGIPAAGLQWSLFVSSL
jgi:hypothetical protein